METKYLNDEENSANTCCKQNNEATSSCGLPVPADVVRSTSATMNGHNTVSTVSTDDGKPVINGLEDLG